MGELYRELEGTGANSSLPKLRAEGELTKAKKSRSPALVAMLPLDCSAVRRSVFASRQEGRYPANCPRLLVGDAEQASVVRPPIASQRRRRSGNRQTSIFDSKPRLRCNVTDVLVPS